MKNTRRTNFGFVLISLMFMILFGCGESQNRISDIVSNPNRFLNHDVSVAGEVTKVYELPLGITNLSAYRVNDGSGQIWVVSHSGAPVVGDRLGIKGKVEDIATMNVPVVGNILGDVISERERRIR